MSVSIPFKRESPCGHAPKRGNQKLSIVSIPFKRESPFGQKTCEEKGVEVGFQFPSNGKVLSDTMDAVGTAVSEELMVSIPFKRESPCGRGQADCDPHQARQEFQFPSNGKVLSDQRLLFIVGAFFYVFQFPSNGKVLSDSPNFSPVQPWLLRAKTKRELRGAFFTQKFNLKFRQTLVNIEPNAIF